MAQWAAYCDGATLIAQVIPSKERDERRPTQDDRQQPLHSSTSTMSLGYARLTWARRQPAAFTNFPLSATPRVP